MGFLDGFRALFNDAPQVQERDSSTLEDFALRILGGNRSTTQPWRAATPREALGVPAVFGAVTLISNVVGSMTLQAYRRGVRQGDEERPRLVVRPNPFTTPRVFFRDTAYHLATRGEAWWWIGARDIDGAALSLIPVNPVEVTVKVNDKDALRPIIEWRGRRMPNDDMVQITYLPGADGLRGMGPLQACQAAISVAVEAQEWAANFYGDGGYPSMLIKSASELTSDEATVLRDQWVSKANNVPRIIDPGIEEVKQFDVNSQGSGMLSGRDFSNGDVARMFRIPGPMLGWSLAGSSLT
jgi:HK97 family phage portal protein